MTQTSGSTRPRSVTARPTCRPSDRSAHGPTTRGSHLRGRSTWTRGWTCSSGAGGQGAGLSRGAVRGGCRRPVRRRAPAARDRSPRARRPGCGCAAGRCSTTRANSTTRDEGREVSSLTVAVPCDVSTALGTRGRPSSSGRPGVGSVGRPGRGAGSLLASSETRVTLRYHHIVPMEGRTPACAATAGPDGAGTMHRASSVVRTRPTRGP